MLYCSVCREDGFISEAAFSDIKINSCLCDMNLGSAPSEQLNKDSKGKLPWNDQVITMTIMTLYCIGDYDLVVARSVCGDRVDWLKVASSNINPSCLFVSWLQLYSSGRKSPAIRVCVKLCVCKIINGKARQGKFIYKAQFVHKAIQSALQLYKIRRRQIKSFHKKNLKK